MGEAAAILASRSGTRRWPRGARIIAEMRRLRSLNDAYHMTAPRPDGRDAGAGDQQRPWPMPGSTPERIGYVNAHASSTPLNEPAEARAILRGLRAHWRRAMPVSGTKGLYGHALGASGAIEAAITAMAIERGVLPGTCNLVTPDPEIDLDVLAAGAPGARRRRPQQLLRLRRHERRASPRGRA